MLLLVWESTFSAGDRHHSQVGTDKPKNCARFSKAFDRHCPIYENTEFWPTKQLYNHFHIFIPETSTSVHAAVECTDAIIYVLWKVWAGLFGMQSLCVHKNSMGIKTIQPAGSRCGFKKICIQIPNISGCCTCCWSSKIFTRTSRRVGLHYRHHAGPNPGFSKPGRGTFFGFKLQATPKVWPLLGDLGACSPRNFWKFRCIFLQSGIYFSTKLGNMDRCFMPVCYAVHVPWVSNWSSLSVHERLGHTDNIVSLESLIEGLLFWGHWQRVHEQHLTRVLGAVLIISMMVS